MPRWFGSLFAPDVRRIGRLELAVVLRQALVLILLLAATSVVTLQVATVETGLAYATSEASLVQGGAPTTQVAGVYVSGARVYDPSPNVSSSARVLATEGSVAVIGSESDTEVAEDWAGHEVLNLPKDEWSLEANDAWVASVADRGMDVYVASPLSEENLWNSDLGVERVFARELKQFIGQYGYTPDGDYLRAP